MPDLAIRPVGRVEEDMLRVVVAFMKWAEV